MTRSEHLQWSKDRALEYVKIGEFPQAWASMTSDLQKHDETADHTAIGLGMMLFMGGQLSTAPEMENFINGFN